MSWSQYPITNFLREGNTVPLVVVVVVVVVGSRSPVHVCKTLNLMALNCKEAYPKLFSTCISLRSEKVL